MREAHPMLETGESAFATAFCKTFNGKIKNIPNMEYTGETFYMSDYVMTDPEMWAFVPDKSDETNAEDVAREVMIDVYENAFENESAIGVDSNVDADEYGDMIWCDVNVSIPTDESEQKHLGELLGETLNKRWNK